MGETQAELFSDSDAVIRPTFNGSIRVEAREERLTSDAGAILAREVMDRIHLIEWLEARLFDPRQPEMITHPLVELLRTELLLLVQGWTDIDDADFLRDDPAFRIAVSNRKQDAPLRSPDKARLPDGLPSQPTLSRLLQSLTCADNPSVLQEANLFCAQQRCSWVGRRRGYDQMVLDVDSFPIQVHGQQAGSAYNGHYHQRCYHPLVFGSADIHTLFGARLRPGNVNSSNGATQDIIKYLDWVESELADTVIVRADAGFPGGDLLSTLEARNTPYLFCFTEYAPLAKMAQPYLSAFQQDLCERPQEVRDKEFHCCELLYKADDWEQPRRVVLVILTPPEGELALPRYFFLITNFSADAMCGELLVDCYRERGSYEDMLGQFKSTLTPQLSSTVRPKGHYRGQKPRQHTDSRDAFATNQVLLSLNVLAFNLMSLMALLHEQAHRHSRPGRPRKYGRTSARITLATLRQYYLKVPARVTLHARRTWFSIGAKAAALWQRLWKFLDRLGYAPVPL